MARREKPVAAASEPVHELLEAAAGHEEAPQRNIVSGAVKRLRARRTAIVHANEFFGMLVAVMRGWTTLLAIEESAHDARRGPERNDRVIRHG